MRGAQFQQRSFSVSAADSRTSQRTLEARCEATGHTEPDRRGRCLRCGERVEVPVATADRVGESDRQAVADRVTALQTAIEARQREFSEQLAEQTAPKGTLLGIITDMAKDPKVGIVEDGAMEPAPAPDSIPADIGMFEITSGPSRHVSGDEVRRAFHRSTHLDRLANP